MGRKTLTSSRDKKNPPHSLSKPIEVNGVRVLHPVLGLLEHPTLPYYLCLFILCLRPGLVYIVSSNYQIHPYT